jgi:hypothetical protein
MATDIPAQTPPQTDTGLLDPRLQGVYLEGKAGGKMVTIYSANHVDTAFFSLEFTGLAQFEHLLFLWTIHTLTGTSPTITFYSNIHDPLGNTYNWYASTAQTAPGSGINSFGPGGNSTSPVPDHVDFQAAFGGTVATASVDLTILGKIGG